MPFLSSLLVSKFVRGRTVAVRPFRVLGETPPLMLRITDQAAARSEVLPMTRADSHASRSASLYRTARPSFRKRGPPPLLRRLLSVFTESPVRVAASFTSNMEPMFASVDARGKPGEREGTCGEPVRRETVRKWRNADFRWRN